MAVIRTVLGDIPADQLGFTLPHEHIVVSWAGAKNDLGDLAYGQSIGFEAICRDVQSAKDGFGLSGIVDAGPVELGRDVSMMVDVSRRTGVHIIASTGFYRQTGGLPLIWGRRDRDEASDHLVREITEGVGIQAVRCGAIKLATSGIHPTRTEAALFRAAASAQMRTGVPIITHTDPEGWQNSNNIGLEQLTMLMDEGVDPSRIMIGHATGSRDFTQLLDLVHRGCYVAFDRIGDNSETDEIYLGMVSGLIGAGFASQVTLSMDHQGAWLPPQADGQIGGAKEFAKLQREFLPRLRAGGISDQMIDQMTVSNPRLLLGF